MFSTSRFVVGSSSVKTPHCKQKVSASASLIMMDARTYRSTRRYAARKPSTNSTIRTYPGYLNHLLACTTSSSHIQSVLSFDHHNSVFVRLSLLNVAIKIICCFGTGGSLLVRQDFDVIDV